MDMIICGTPKDGDVEIIGPQPAPIPRIAGKYRWHIVLKSTDSKRMSGLIWKAVSAARREDKDKKVMISIIPDPQSIL